MASNAPTAILWNGLITYTPKPSGVHKLKQTGLFTVVAGAALLVINTPTINVT
jgi:hypothetical protein